MNDSARSNSYKSMTDTLSERLELFKQPQTMPVLQTVQQQWTSKNTIRVADKQAEYAFMCLDIIYLSGNYQGTHLVRSTFLNHHQKLKNCGVHSLTNAKSSSGAV